MSLEVSVSGSLLTVEEDGRDRLTLTRDEAFELLEKIEDALVGMPVLLKQEGGL